jgi:hypothetical protein
MPSDRFGCLPLGASARPAIRITEMDFRCLDHSGMGDGEALLRMTEKPRALVHSRMGRARGAQMFRNPDLAATYRGARIGWSRRLHRVEIARLSSAV